MKPAMSAVRPLGARVRSVRMPAPLTLCALAVCVLLGPSVASAAQTRPLTGTFGAEASTVPDPYPLSSPQGIAVKQTSGDLYVADMGNSRIEKFDATGHFLLTFGADVGGPGVNSCETLCGPGTPGSAPGAFTEASFVAVDNSAGPSAGDVYVADTADNLVSKFDPAGKLITSWGSGGQLSGSSTTAGTFGPLAGVAVGASGTLYVLNSGSRLFRFAQDGSFSSEATLERGTEPRGLGLDAAGNIFKINADASIEKFTPPGSDVGQITFDREQPPAAAAFTIDPATGGLYLASETIEPSGTSRLQHYSFNGTGHVIEPDGSTCENYEHGPTGGCAPSDSVSIPFQAPGGIAVASAAGDTYLSNRAEGAVYRYGPLVPLPDALTGSASSIHPTTALLNGTINPEGVPVTQCSFQYGTEEGVYPHSVPCAQAPAQIGSGTSPVPVSAEVAGLTEGVTYHFRLSAGNEHGPADGADQAFTTTTPPAITNPAAKNLGATSAELVAQINPDNGETTYHFEYGETTAYGTSIPVLEGSIGEGSSEVPVKVQITGLHAGRTYHFRVLAKNGAGPTTSKDHTFIYAPEGGALPDGRAYEMVTPARKNGALIGDVILGVEPEISESGSRVMLSSIQPFAGSGSGNANRQGEGEPYAFERSPTGWATTPLAPPATEFDVNSPFNASAQANTVLFTMPAHPAGEDDFYARGSDGSFRDIGPVTPPVDGEKGPEAIGSRLHDATADLSHLVFESKPTWTEFDGSIQQSVYEYIGTGNTRPALVGVTGAAGSTDLISRCGTVLGGTGSQPAKSYGSLSSDGSRVYFTALRCPEGGTGINKTLPVPADELYARIGGSETVLISGRSPEGCTEPECRNSPPGDALFAGASADGSKVFFTSTQRLTDTATQDPEPADTASASGCHLTTAANGCNLYEYDFAREAGGRLSALSTGAHPGEGPEVQGVMAIAPDGSHVYFVAKGRLTETPNAENALPQAGKDNLYVANTAAGGVSFIATLPEADSPEWETGVSQANVTPDGRNLVFTSHGLLTADDTRSDGAQQVFSYDAATGALERISIGNNGFNDNGNAGSGNAIIVPAERTFFHNGPPRSDPTMSHDGSYVFFQSPVALTPHALNDVPIDPSGDLAENVYEYHAGHVYLISDGKDANAAEIGLSGLTSAVDLIGTDGTGANVIFTTADELLPQDTDTQLDYYDARICTTTDPCVTPPPQPAPPCREACQAPLSAAPPPPAPGSASFHGPGNLQPQGPKPATAPKPLTRAQKLTKALKACRTKQNKHKRASCERAARAKYGAKAKPTARRARRKGSSS